MAPTRTKRTPSAPSKAVKRPEEARKAVGQPAGQVEPRKATRAASRVRLEAAGGMKRCSLCRKSKPVSSYHKRTISNDGLAAHCKECRKERELRKLYGISLADWMVMWEAQEGKCAFCLREPDGSRIRALHVDHDHACCPRLPACGQCVRGLLCLECNQASGKLQEDPQTFRRAADYLESGGTGASLGLDRRPTYGRYMGGSLLL